MPRSHRRHRAAPGPHIDGLSARTRSEICHLEDTRNYLSPGCVILALGRWREYVRRPERELWREHTEGDVYGGYDGDPYEARALPDTVMRALSTPSARELRRLLARSDAVWDRR
ncbi:hypothetical protein AB0D49_40455 [Streptomyces sp. NPDC048290]|uniref:hypothetical protein n=1 Tax=Streptomyces sp. NPDC048290 TaxID=3155811 RepID=UPI0034145A37